MNQKKIPRFSDNGNGTVTDNTTGLIWLKNANCFGSNTWDDAVSAVADLASGQCGLTDGSSAGDWQLPGMTELFSLLDYRFVPALSNTLGTGVWTEGDPFINVTLNRLYWSSTTAVQMNPDLAWEVHFGSGNISDDYKTSQYSVWPVKGQIKIPTPRFNDNGDGTVTDNLTGVVWLKNANCFGLRLWDEAVSDVARLRSGHCGLTDGSRPGDWRLPTIAELEMLMNLAYLGPAVSNTAGTGQWTEGDPFNGIIVFNLYWSSTSYAGHTRKGAEVEDPHNVVGALHEIARIIHETSGSGAVWVELVSSGNISTTMKNGFFYVWPVREKK